MADREQTSERISREEWANRFDAWYSDRRLEGPLVSPRSQPNRPTMTPAINDIAPDATLSSGEPAHEQPEEASGATSARRDPRYPGSCCAVCSRGVSARRRYAQEHQAEVRTGERPRSRRDAFSGPSTPDFITEYWLNVLRWRVWPLPFRRATRRVRPGEDE